MAKVKNVIAGLITLTADHFPMRRMTKALKCEKDAACPPLASWRGFAMPTVVAHHKISKGAQHWLNSPKRNEFFGPLGVTNIRAFVDPTDSTRVALVMDIPNMDAVMAAMQSQAAKDAMAHDGVVPESLVILVES